MGRPSKYQTHVKPYFEQIEGWFRSGKTEGSIAKQLGVNNDSWIQYKKKFPEFSELLIKAGQDNCALVANKLFQRACGYDYTEKHVEIGEDGDGVTRTKRKTIKKHVPPNVAAMEFYLVNRDPNNWKHKSHIEGEIEVNSFSGVSDEVLEKRAEQLRKSREN